MSDPAKTGELKLWAESLRDKVSRVSGRTANVAGAGFNSELKVELLDAIDLLLEQAGAVEMPPDPIESAMEKLSEMFRDFVRQQESAVVSRVAELTDQNREVLERAEQLCQQLEAEREQQSQHVEGREKIQQLWTQWAEKQDALQQFADASMEQADQVLDSLRGVSEKLVTQTTRDGIEVDELKAKIRRLESELERTQFELELARENSSDGENLSAGEAGYESELNERLEEAVQEIERLKTQNAELQSQLAGCEEPSRDSELLPSGDSESLSWEERKQLMLQRYLTEDGHGDVKQESRSEIEEVIASTDQELKRKDGVIEELRRQLEQSNMKESDDSHLSAVLDADELIQMERAKLQVMQEEWEEKLRQAEIEFSVERAKLARERLELEAERSQARGKIVEEKGEKVRKRKWLDHLGLREDDKS